MLVVNCLQTVVAVLVGVEDELGDGLESAEPSDGAAGKKGSGWRCHDTTLGDRRYLTPHLYMYLYKYLV